MRCSWSSLGLHGGDPMGLKPKFADKGLTIVPDDESPDALEGIKDGTVLECKQPGFG